MENKKTNTMAIVGFILSFFVPIVGLILSIIALNQIKKTNEGGKGLAIAGVVLGSLGLVFVVIAIIAAFNYVFLWPSIQADINQNTQCANAICDCKPGEKYCDCTYYDEHLNKYDIECRNVDD